MSQIIRVDPITGVGVIVNTKYSLPKYDIDMLIKLKNGSIAKILDICMQVDSTDKGVETIVWYATDNNLCVDEDDVVELVKGE